MSVGKVVGVKVASTSVGNVVPVGGRVSVGNAVGEDGVVHEMRRKRMTKVERIIRETTEWDMERILSHLLCCYPRGCVGRTYKTTKSPSLQNRMNCLRLYFSSPAKYSSGGVSTRSKS